MFSFKNIQSSRFSSCHSHSDKPVNVFSSNYNKIKFYYNKYKIASAHYDHVCASLQLKSTYFNWVPIFRHYYNFFISFYCLFFFIIKVMVFFDLLSLSSFIMFTLSAILFLSTLVYGLGVFLDNFYYSNNKNLFIVKNSPVDVTASAIIKHLATTRTAKIITGVSVSSFVLADSIDNSFNNYRIPDDSKSVKYIPRFKKVFNPNQYPGLTFGDRLFNSHYRVGDSGPLSLEDALMREREKKDKD